MSAVLLAACVVVGTVVACAGSAQPASPAPSAAQSGTPVPTVAPTTDPSAAALQQADSSLQNGDTAGAISQYAAILTASDDPTVRAAAFTGLDGAGSTSLTLADTQHKQSGSHEDGIVACATYKLAESAYAPILAADDAPELASEYVYVRAALTSVALIDCHRWYDDPEQGYGQIINSLLDGLASYPDRPAVMDVLVPAIVETYRDMADGVLFAKYGDTPEELTTLGAALAEKVGPYETDGKKAADVVNVALAQAAVCSETRFDVPALQIGTSTNKRVESCPFFGDGSTIDAAGLRAADLTEIWFVLENETVDSDDVQCTGHRTDTGTDFTYSYPGPYRDKYILKDARTGKVVATKTFVSTAPRCVFTDCTLNTLSNTATCRGGEGQSTFNEDSLAQWMKGAAR